MLRLVKTFDLQKDIYSKLPAARLKLPQVYLDKLRERRNSLAVEDREAPQPTQLNASRCRLSVVGQEKTGHVLISYDGFDDKGRQRTFIDLYDPKTKKLKSIYRHDSHMYCVGATISEQHTLLAFTVVMNMTQEDVDRREKVKGRTYTTRDRVFQSYIAEVRQQGMLYKLSIREPIIQRVQFLYTGKTKLVNLLFFLDGVFVHLYQVPTKAKRRGGVEITSQPNLVSIVAKQHSWFQWDAQRNSLFLLQKYKSLNTSSSGSSPALADSIAASKGLASSTGNVYSSSSSKQQFMLRMFYFPDKAYKLKWEVPLRMELHKSSGFNSLYALHNTCLKYYWGVNHRAANPTQHTMEVIRLNGNSYVLCQQHTHTKDHKHIVVSLFMVHHKASLTLRIPMNDQPAEAVKHTRVFFGAIANMLLVYVPKHHFQLVDCGADHPPTLSLAFSGPEYATAIPDPPRTVSFPNAVVSISRSSSDVYQSSAIAAVGTQSSDSGSEDSAAVQGTTEVELPALLVRFSATSEPTNLHGHIFFDCIEGKAYEYFFEREALCNLFAKPLAQAHVQALHLAMVHMHDMELVDQIIRLLCRKYPENLSAPVLKEYLIGMPFEVIRSNATNAQLQSVLPITGQPPLYYSKKRRYKCSELKGYYVLPHAQNLNIRDREQPRLPPRFRHDVVMVASDQRFVDIQQTSTKPQALMKLLSMLQSSPEEVKLGAPIDVVEDFHKNLSRGSCQFADAVGSHLLACFPRMPKPFAMQLATEYRTRAADHTNTLYDSVVDAVKDLGAELRFQVLENLYCVLEELSYHCPRGFSALFVEAGYRTLPRSVFLQYLERGIFCLNESFIEDALSNLGSSRADQLFKYELLSSFENYKQSFKIMRDHPEYVNYLLQYFLSNLPLAPPSKAVLNGPADLESTNDSPFIPRSVFLNAIMSHYGKNDYQVIVDFISANKHRLHRSVLTHAQKDPTMSVRFLPRIERRASRPMTAGDGV